MSSQKQLFDKLKDTTNLNTYEVKIYVSLLSRGISSAGELADISGVPRSRCYDVLESLEKKGFVFLKIGKPIKYLVVPPEEALETLKKQAKQEELRLLELMEELKGTDTFLELKQLFNGGTSYVDNTQLSHAIVGRQNINLFMKEMLSRAEKSIVIHTDKEGIKRKSKILRKSHAKNVPVTIHAPSQSSEDKNIKISNKKNSLRLVNVDDEEILFFTSPSEIDPALESAIWIKSKPAIITFKSMMS